MKTKFALILALAALTSSCASPARELKAPCGPLTGYAEDDHCGEAKPVNAALENVLVK
jgi:hypothetical protein